MYKYLKMLSDGTTKGACIMKLRKNGCSKSYFSLKRYQFLFLNSVLATVLIFIIFYSYIHTDDNQTISSNFIRSERKLFLLWTPFFRQSEWLPSTSALNCTVKECDVTSNRTLLASSSAVIMHWRNLDLDDLPGCAEQNKDNQTVVLHCPKLILFNKEAPPNTPSLSLEKLNNRIHMMVTYRRDSEVYAPYGKIVRRKNYFKIPDPKPNRSMVCWLVSNCETSSSREDYVNQLKRYIHVEVYGKCGTESCPYESVMECYKWLSDRCKFYLSFENSICKDYATEKLYYTMMTDMVPVVLGGDDYARYLPSESYIDVADFDKPEDLASYLRELDKDEIRYMSYFNWKKYYMATFVPFSWFCDLCEYFHTSEVDNLKTYADVRSWWFDEGDCGPLVNWA